MAARRAQGTVGRADPLQRPLPPARPRRSRAADPTGDWFTFEKGASKATGGEGWADVWRKGAFGWEYKGRHKDLDAAHRQLLMYAAALENPPLLVTCDTDRIVIRTNFTNTVQEAHTILLDDLLDGAKRDLLRAAFTDPDRLRPTKTRDALTAEAAAQFSDLAQRLHARGHDPQAVAHFVNRLVFCMFAEDVSLLPETLFQKMLDASRADPASFAPNAARLFAAMQSGGHVGFTRVDWFNGGLFDDDTALPLERADILDLIAAARLDWCQIDPSILGTLFERGLDPAKRSQLGAHYTDRDKIMKIVNPVVVEPLLAEWAEAKAEIEAALAREKAAKSASAATVAHKAARARLAASSNACAPSASSTRPAAPATSSTSACARSRTSSTASTSRPRPSASAAPSPPSAPRPCSASSSTPTPPSSPASRSGSARSSGCAPTATRPAATRSSARSTPSNAATPS